MFEIDKDHFSLTELKSFANDIGYEEVGAFYVEDPATYRFVKLESDNQLYNCVKELRSGSTFKLFLKHVPIFRCASRASHLKKLINEAAGSEQVPQEENNDFNEFEEKL